MKRPKRLRIIHLVVLAALAASAVLTASPPRRGASAAGPLYVAPGGTDTGTCTLPAAPCATLGAAISKASSGDTIFVASGVYTGTGSVVAEVADSVTLSGGWDVAFGRQTGYSTIDGEEARGGVQITGGALAAIERFVIEHTTGSVAVYDSTLHLSRSSLRSSTAYAAGGGLYAYNSVLTLTNSSLHDNVVSFGEGGAIRQAGGRLTLTNVTISRNRASAGAGGLSVTSVTLDVSNSTISQNTSLLGHTGGIASQYSDITLRNSILAENAAPSAGASQAPDCEVEGSPLQSAGYNLIGDTTGCALALAASDLGNVSAGLDVLGGAPAHQPLLPGSPAVNGGNPAGCVDAQGTVLAADQRGMPRVGICDIGAYELGLKATQSLEGQLEPGGRVTYTLSLLNAEGSIPLTHVVLTDTLPAFLTYLPGTLAASQGLVSESANTISWTGTVSGTLATTVTFAAEISPSLPAGQTISNVALATWQQFTLHFEAAFDTLNRYRFPVIQHSFYRCHVDLLDDFSDSASGWPVEEDEYLGLAYVGGEYQVEARQGGYLFLVRAPTCRRQNYIVEADVRWASAPGNSYGLIFGVADDFTQYYLFDVNTEAQAFRLYRRTPGDFVEVVPITASAAINAGTASNHLKATRNAGWIGLTVNDTFLGLWPDTSQTPGVSRAGLVASAYYAGPAAEARFDNFRFTALPDSALLSGPTLPANDSAEDPASYSAQAWPEALRPWRATR